MTSKVWVEHYGYEETRKSVEESLRKLQIDYLALLFLHQPTDNWREGYKQIEKAYKEGKVKAIDLSNFPQNELKKMLAQTGMGLIAWYPLCGNGTERRFIKGRTAA